MNTLDIILINTISYMTGIFTGLIISYNLRLNKRCDKNDNENNEPRIMEKEYHEEETDKHLSPLQASIAYASAPPPLSLNPEYINEKKKTITITTTE